GRRQFPGGGGHLDLPAAVDGVGGRIHRRGRWLRRPRGSAGTSPDDVSVGMNTRSIQWLAVAVLGLVVVWGVFIAGSVGDPAMRLAADIACPVCAGESVA